MKSLTRPGRALLLFLLGALVWAGCGSDTDTATTDTSDADTAMSDDEMADDEMADDEMDDMAEAAMAEPVEAASAVVEGQPSVKFVATPDAMSGFNVHVTATNFDSSAGTGSTTNVDGEGFYYLTVDGDRLFRFYNDWIHVDNLPTGEVVLGVELASNDGEPVTVDGAVVAASTTTNIGDHNHNDGTHSHGGDDVEYVELTAIDPSIGLTVEKDPIAGVNVDIAIAGLKLAPEHASSPSVDGEGHMHLYIDGVKVARLYGMHFNYGAELSGEHEFMVSANANDHRPYMVDGDPLEATAIFDADL